MVILFRETAETVYKMFKCSFGEISNICFLTHLVLLFSAQVSQLAPMTISGPANPSLQSQFNSSESSVACTDPWSISPEQRAYYLSQFIRLQSDPRGKLSGSQAKLFFELSKLPTAELSDIWYVVLLPYNSRLMTVVVLLFG